MTLRDQIRRAWEVGAEAPDGWGWDVGQVEPDMPHTPTGEGSQTPPARDRDGVPFDAGDDAGRVASRWLRRQVTASRSKTAGEVRFIKDQRGDGERWGWPPPGPGERNIGSDYKFDPTKIKPLASTLRSSLMALGHSLSAYQRFTKLKSATISPDGNLGGMGYILKITEIRQQYMNIVEALSSITDTLYDEVHAPHWNPVKEEQSPDDRKETQDIMEDVEEIRNDPEEFAQEEEEDMDSGNPKKAFRGSLGSLQGGSYER